MKLSRSHVQPRASRAVLPVYERDSFSFCTYYDLSRGSDDLQGCKWMGFEAYRSPTRCQMPTTSGRWRFDFHCGIHHAFEGLTLRPSVLLVAASSERSWQQQTSRAVCLPWVCTHLKWFSAMLPYDLASVGISSINTSYSKYILDITQVYSRILRACLTLNQPCNSPSRLTNSTDWWVTRWKHMKTYLQTHETIICLTLFSPRRLPGSQRQQVYTSATQLILTCIGVDSHQY